MDQVDSHVWFPPASRETDGVKTNFLVVSVWNRLIRVYQLSKSVELEMISLPTLLKLLVEPFLRFLGGKRSPTDSPSLYPFNRYSLTCFLLDTLNEKRSDTLAFWLLSIYRVTQFTCPALSLSICISCVVSFHSLHSDSCKILHSFLPCCVCDIFPPSISIPTPSIKHHFLLPSFALQTSHLLIFYLVDDVMMW